MSSQVIAMNLNLIMKREGEIVTTPSELAEEAEVTIIYLQNVSCTESHG